MLINKHIELLKPLFLILSYGAKAIEHKSYILWKK